MLDKQNFHNEFHPYTQDSFWAEPWAGLRMARFNIFGFMG